MKKPTYLAISQAVIRLSTELQKQIKGSTISLAENRTDSLHFKSDLPEGLFLVVSEKDDLYKPHIIQPKKPVWAISSLPFHSVLERHELKTKSHIRKFVFLEKPIKTKCQYLHLKFYQLMDLPKLELKPINTAGQELEAHHIKQIQAAIDTHYNWGLTALSRKLNVSYKQICRIAKNEY